MYAYVYEQFYHDWCEFFTICSKVVPAVSQYFYQAASSGLFPPFRLSNNRKYVSSGIEFYGLDFPGVVVTRATVMKMTQNQRSSKANLAVSLFRGFYEKIG